MKRFHLLLKALLWGIVGAGLGANVQAVEPTTPVPTAATAAKAMPSPSSFLPLADQVAPITSFELSQLDHHFDLSGAAEALSMMERAPVDPEEQFYVSDRRSAENILSSLTTIEQMHLAKVGVALLNQDGIVLLYSGARFPLMSVMKFHVAYAVLSQIVERGDRLRSTLNIKLKDLDPDTYSPMYEELQRRDFIVNNCEPGGHIAPAINAVFSAYGTACEEGPAESEPYHIWADMYLQSISQGPLLAPTSASLHTGGYPQTINICLGDLLYYAVRESDNNACDLLINYYLGGMDKLEQFWHDKGVTGLSLKYTESQMAEDPARCYANSATPYDLALSYAVYLNDTKLPEVLRSFLDETMLFPPTGQNRIQRAVTHSLRELAASSSKPESELFASLRIFDKTGTDGLNAQGQRIAVNDLAYINFEGKPYILAVLAKDISGTAQSSSNDGEMALRKASRVAFTAALRLFHYAEAVTSIDLVRSCSSQGERGN